MHISPSLRLENQPKYRTRGTLRHQVTAYSPQVSLNGRGHRTRPRLPRRPVPSASVSSLHHSKALRPPARPRSVCKSPIINLSERLIHISTCISATGACGSITKNWYLMRMRHWYWQYLSSLSNEILNKTTTN